VKNLLPCANTVRNWLMAEFKARKPEVKQSLANAKSKINLSIDLWSTPNDLSLLGIVAHWIDSKGNLKTALLALRRSDSHYGVDIEPLLRLVIKEYNIGEKLGAVQDDNADNKRHVLARARSGLSEVQL